MTRTQNRILRIVAIVAILGLLAFFVRNLDWAGLGRALEDAKWWPIALAAALNFAHMFGMAVTWHIMLRPKHHVSPLRIWRYTIASFAASAVVPARGGELLRLWALKTRDGVPTAEGAAAAIGEKLVAAFTLLLLGAPVPLVLDLPAWVGDSMLIGMGALLAAFVLLWFLVGKVEVTEDSNWLRRWVGGLHVVRNGPRFLLAMLAMIGTWAVDMAMVMLALYAVGIDLPLPAAVLILVMLNVVIMVPSTPAGIGAMEAGVLAATRILHVPDEPALAFGLLYHMLQTLPTVVAGFALELRLILNRQKRVDSEAN